MGLVDIEVPWGPKSGAFLKSRDERKRVEMRFAHLKIHRGFERMRLRGLSGARDEFHARHRARNWGPSDRRFGPPETAQIDAGRENQAVCPRW
jgi:hypothetical protein